jgi:Flp pilus assembly pilin Flp
MRKFLVSLLKDRSGSNALEYGLIVGLISLVGLATAQATGTSLGTLFTAVNTAITTAVAAV